jgi:hypothetical protein
MINQRRSTYPDREPVQTTGATSVHILRCGVPRCSEVRVDVPEIRLALRCLLPHCPEKWPLTMFWGAAGQQNDIGPAQGVTAAFNGIVRQLRRAGCYEEVLNQECGTTPCRFQGVPESTRIDLRSTVFPDQREISAWIQSAPSKVRIG